MKWPGNVVCTMLRQNTWCKTIVLFYFGSGSKLLLCLLPWFDLHS